MVYGNRMNPHDDHISLHGLGLVACVGVPDAERAIPQRLEADVVLWPAAPLQDLADDIGRTIDYSAAAALIREIAAGSAFQLIETLAETLCQRLLTAFPLIQVRLSIRKFILPDTESVAVTLTRRGPGTPAAFTP